MRLHRLPALIAAAGLALGSAAVVAPIAASAAPAPAAATAVTPNVWYVDQSVRHFFTVKLNRTVCDGSVDVTIYSRSGQIVDWWYETIDGCRNTVVFDENLYDWNAAGKLGAGTAKVEVSDYSGDAFTRQVRTFPFYVKTAASQTTKSARSGRYVTLSGVTRRYNLANSWDASWVGAASTPVQYQKLVGKTWKTVATVKTNRVGASSVRLYAPTKAAYRAYFPGSATQAGAASTAQTR